MAGQILNRKDQYALITGGSAGIGKALAIQLARMGKPVLLVALPGQDLEETVQWIRTTLGVDAQGFGIDLREKDSPLRVFRWVKDSGFLVDFLVNNAGMGGAGSFEMMTWESIHEYIDLNVRSVTLMTHCFLPLLSSAGSAWILNVSSMAAFFDIPYKSLYSATKSHVLSLSRSLNAELKPMGIHVSVLCPNAVLTSEEVNHRIKLHGQKMRLLQVTTEQLAKRTLSKMSGGRFLILQSRLDRFLYLGSRVLPKRWQSRLLFKEFSKEMNPTDG